MRAILTTVFMFLAMLALASFAAAQNDAPKAFYNQCIDHKIAQCEVKASRIDSGSSHISHAAEVAEAQAAFYRTHREALVEAMVRHNLPLKEHRVQHFLNKAYSIEVAKSAPGS